MILSIGFLNISTGDPPVFSDFSKLGSPKEKIPNRI